ncbi:MAG: HEAT repeat domain-containing protein [bacterium]
MREFIIIGAILVVVIVLLFASGAGLYLMFWADKTVYEVKEGIKTAGYKDKSKEELKPIVRGYVRESNKLRGIPLLRRYTILKSIAKTGKPGVEILIEILKDKEEGKNMVEFAYSGAGEISMRLATLYVISQISNLGKEGEKELKEAYEAIREQIPALVDVLLHDEDVEVRMETAETLGDIGDNRAVEGLIKALEDNGESDGRPVRGRAAWALAKIKDSRAIEPLIETLVKYGLVGGHWQNLVIEGL